MAPGPRRQLHRRAAGALGMGSVLRTIGPRRALSKGYQTLGCTAGPSDRLFLGTAWDDALITHRPLRRSEYFRDAAAPRPLYERASGGPARERRHRPLWAEPPPYRLALLEMLHRP